MRTVVIDGEQFNECAHKEVESPLRLTLRTNGKAYLGATLRRQLNRQVCILATPDGRKIALASDVQGPYWVGNNGTVSAAALAAQLLAVGIALPARYAFARRGEWWIGTLLAPKPAAPRPERAAEKPRKRGLADMLPKGGCP